MAADSPAQVNGSWRDYWSLAANRNFVLLWLGQLAFFVGVGLSSLSFLFCAGGELISFLRLFTPITVGLLLPIIVFAPVAGVVADRISRKATAIAAALVLLAVCLAMALLAERTAPQKLPAALCYAALIVLAVSTAVFHSAKTALIPQLVPKVQWTAANSLCCFAAPLAAAVVPFLSAKLNGAEPLSLPAYLRYCSLAAFLCAAFFALVNRPASEPNAAGRTVRLAPAAAVREGIRYIHEHRRVLQLVVLSATVYFAAGLVVATVLSVVQLVRNLGDWSENPLLAALILSLSMTAGAVITTLTQQWIRSADRVVARCFFFMALAILPFGLWRRMLAEEAAGPRIYWEVVAPLLMVIGAFGGALIVLVVTLLQRSTPQRVHGRIFALNALGDATAILLAMTISAWLLPRGLTGLIVLIACIALFAASTGIRFSDEFARHNIIRWITRVVLRLYCRVEHEGRENVPLTGPLIVAANHSSWIDTFLLGAAVPRLIHYLAAREYYDRWYMRWFMRMFGTIPIERGKGHREPLNRALWALRRGRCIGIFPEGHMTKTGQLQKFQGGAALMAEETGAPILPAAIIGAFECWGPKMRFPRPRKVRVRLGRPIDPRGLSRDEILARLEAAIRALLEKKDSECP
ncbi:MAG: MFS transporter [Candidatus Sumerlaeia bacterium]|nr:MFS transporter [Candidatus Sumerlaeia bacterium]